MDRIAQVRRFNRTVTRRIGALNGHFLGRRRSLGASRLLFEIGRQGIEVRELRSRLELDSGYTSRMLRALEADGLILTGPAPGDARVRYVRLTPAGRREVALLNRRSDAAALALLEPLSERQRTALMSAMATVESLLLAGAVRLEVESPTSPVARDCLARYFAELSERFETGFDPALSISAASEELTPPQGFFVVAWRNGDAVGCGALKCHPDYGEIKRMWVESSCRGLGIGRRILQRLEDLGRERRLPLLRLETNKSLTEAQSLYRSSGYREVRAFNDEPYAHHWFQKALDETGSADRTLPHASSLRRNSPWMRPADRVIPRKGPPMATSRRESGKKAARKRELEKAKHILQEKQGKKRDAYRKVSRHA